MTFLTRHFRSSEYHLFR